MSDKKNSIDLLAPNEKSLNELIIQYKDKLLKRASDSIRRADPDKQEQFLQRIIASLVKNEGLRDCFSSVEGKISIFTLIDDCLRTGLSLDHHAYAIPYSKRRGDGTFYKYATLQIKRQGYHAMLCGGDRPIFKDLKWGVVYEKEKDDIKIDRASGEITHPISISDNRGKPIGVWVQAIKINGSKEAEYYPISMIYSIRDNHSKTYQDYKDKKISTCTWVTDEIPMIEKTAIKAFCRPYADVCEELSNAIYSEGDDVDSINTEPTNSGKADIVLKNAGDNLQSAIDDYQSEPKEIPVEKENTNKRLF